MKVVFYTDFDGTITGREGSQVVFTSFYQSLFQDYVDGEVRDDYRSFTMKSAEEVQRIFEKKFSIVEARDTDLLMGKAAISFFHYALQNDDIKINIVTRNRADYVKALMKYQGFSDTELNRLSIWSFKSKHDVVKTNIKQSEDEMDVIYVLDDNLMDYHEMSRAAEECGYKKGVNLFPYHMPPGKFNWGNYHQDVIKKLDLKRPLMSKEKQFVDVDCQTDEQMAVDKNRQLLIKNLQGYVDSVKKNQRRQFTYFAERQTKNRLINCRLAEKFIQDLQEATQSIKTIFQDISAKRAQFCDADSPWGNYIFSDELNRIIKEGKLAGNAEEALTSYTR